MSSNIFQRLRELVPLPAVFVGKVLEHHSDDTSTVEIPGALPINDLGNSVATGSLIRPRGTTVPVGKKAFVRAGVIETQAPDGDPIDIPIGRVTTPSMLGPSITLSYSGGGGTVAWTPVPSATGWNVYRDGVKLNPTPLPGGSTSYPFTATVGGLHCFKVEAITPTGSQMSAGQGGVLRGTVNDIVQASADPHVACAAYWPGGHGYVGNWGDLCYSSDALGNFTGGIVATGTTFNPTGLC